MIALRSPELFVRLDPRHGAEILDLVDLSSGRQLLGRPPFGSTAVFLVLASTLSRERLQRPLPATASYVSGRAASP